MGSAQSARGIQLGGQGTAARCGRISPSRGDLSPGAAGPRRAHFLRGGAPRPALVRPGKAWGEGGTPLRWRALQRPPPGPRRFPGPWNECPLRLLRLRAGTGPPAPGATVDRGGLSSVRPNRVASPGRGSAHVNRRQGSAAMSATHPTRLETRTKESNARASQRVTPETPWRNESEGRRAPPEVGSRPPGAPGAPPARLARSVGEVEHERAR